MRQSALMRGRAALARSRIHVGALVGLLAGLLASGLAASCLIEADERLSCGDGYVSAVEACDPRDPELGHVDACRDRGFMTDAECDPTTCEILDSPSACNVCGDGIALGSEECDGDDLRGQTCALGQLGCTAACELDFGDCPQNCGDGVVSGDEECDFARDCEAPEDCDEGQVCYEPLGECVATGGGFLPLVACVDYSSALTKPNVGKPYVSGIIGDCTQQCFYARDQCSFCGDDELDDAYLDVTGPSGTVPIPAEVCDGSQALPEPLAVHCRPFCLDPPYDPNIDVRCDFDCKDDCRGIEPPNDITPGEINPEKLHCCLGPGSACVGDGVPDLPCCATPDLIKPDGCAWSATPPIALVCPGF